MDASNIQENIHLKDYIDVLRRRRDIAILFFLTTVLIVAVGSFIMKPVYRATTTLLIDIESPNVLTASGSIETQSPNYYAYKEYYQSQIEIMTSEPVIRKVFDEFNLRGLKEYATTKEPLKAFSKTISVEPVRDTRLAKLNVDNEDPEIAAKIANRIAEIYVKRNLSYISRNELLNLLKNEYLRLEAKLAEYSKIYKNDHPEMIRLKQEMDELITKIEQEKKSAIAYDIGEEYAKSDYKHALEGLKANNISIVTPAVKPALPIKPKKGLNVLIAIVIGLFGGVGLAFFVEYLDDTIKDLEALERLVNWPFLGSIPKIEGDGKKPDAERNLFVHINPKDPIAELFRAIRTSIFLSATKERPSRNIVITSPGPEEGKTVIICNLAIAMAQSGKRVLLVDADMRKSRLHDVFKKENKTGLSSFLCGQEEVEALVQKTDVENLFLITSGAPPPNPSELLGPDKMKEFISTAEKNFDIVLLDSPPIALITDAVILSRMVDGIIMVIENGKTSKRMLLRIYKLLNTTKARVIGMVFNKSFITDRSYYYYSRYYGR